MLALLLASSVAGAAWLRLANAREDRRATTSLERVTTRSLATTTARLARVSVDIASTEALIAKTTRARDDLRALAAGLTYELQRTRRSTTDSNVDAFVTGSRANVLMRCLAGVSRALNQLSVGDAGALANLQAVAAPCRAAQTS